MGNKLIKCEACGHEISKKVKACPSCGEPNKKGGTLLKTLFKYFMILSAVGLIGGLIIPKKEVKPKTAKEIKKEKELKAKEMAEAAKLKKKHKAQCHAVHVAFSKTIKAGASVKVVSKGASDLYDKVRDATSECAYIRYAFRTLRKPYEGDEISQKEWDQAIYNFLNKKEY
jgi:rRNA maturation endonuclease Nob1